MLSAMRLPLALAGLFCAAVCAAEPTSIPHLRAEHPRLIAPADAWQRLATRRTAEPALAAYWQRWIAYRQKNAERFHRIDAQLLAEHLRIAEDWS